MKSLHIALVLGLTACGTQPKAEETDASKTTTAPTTKPVDDGKTVEKADTTPEDDISTSAPKALTKDQTLRMLIRASFDSLYRDGKVFEVPGISYVIKADHGTMGYPDVMYVPQGRDVRSSCPLGFAIPSNAELLLALSKGLLGALPTDQAWIWSSTIRDLPQYNGTVYEYWAVSVEDQVINGAPFLAGQMYPLHKARTDAQVYCTMNVRDLPKVDDIPADTQAAFALTTAPEG